MLSQIKPQKGKDFKKLPGKTLDSFYTNMYLQSIKYDGNQIFIVKMGRSVNFYTSDWKPFTIEAVAMELYLLEDDFLLVGEFMYDSMGKLGDRRKSAKLTTYRTNHSKELTNSASDEAKTNIKVFDVIQLAGSRLVTNVPARLRLQYAEELTNKLKFLSTAQTTLVDGATALEHNKELIKRGWEGSMLIDPDPFYEVGKRVNHAIKLKGRLTADLLCIDTELGDGKYTDMVGALVLKDSKGRVVNVGSGLSDSDRGYHEDYYIGKVIEIEYEQIIDTYIQPTFIRVRDDKTKEEID